MAEPILHLAPYENSLRRRRDMDGEAVFFEANCFGRVRKFVGQSINEDGYGNSYFARLRDESQRGIFVCSGYGKGSEESAQPYKDWGRCTREIIVETLKEGIESSCWRRYFVLDKSLNLADSNNGFHTLFLNWNGLGMIHEDKGGFARFRWNEPCPEEMWNCSAAELLKRVVEQSRDESNETYFAWRWASLSNAEHFDLMLPLSKGTYREWQDICRLLPIALVRYSEYLDAKLYVNFSSDGEAKSNFYEQSGRPHYQAISSHLLQRLSLWLHDYFAPQPNEDLCARYLCARQWLKPNQRSVCKVRIDAPTQHERLEALLQLRDWLADKATPAEIEALLRAD